jgi:hypothetical protein
MRAALALLALASCGPLPRAPKCVEVPAPVAADFATCGGLAYHAGPGPMVPFAIKLTNAMGERFVLTSACVLVDDYSVLPKDKLEWSGNLFKGKHVVKVQAIYQDKSGSTVTIRSAAEIASLEPGTLELVAHEEGVEKRPQLRWNKPKGSTCE